MIYRDGNGRVSLDRLFQIAQILDEDGYSKPSAFLEGKMAKKLNRHNQKNGHSKTKKIMTWTDLVTSRDKRWIRAMRKTLLRRKDAMMSGKLSLEKFPVYGAMADSL